VKILLNNNMAGDISVIQLMHRELEHSMYFSAVNWYMKNLVNIITLTSKHV